MPVAHSGDGRLSGGQSQENLEGLAGGVLASGVVASIVAAILLPIPWHHVLPLGLFMGLWASAGDLFESMLKRAANVKDSGTLLMGHGGVWDRIDALTFNTPWFCCLFPFFPGGRAGLSRETVKLVVLGSTGSVGVNTLDVAARFPDRFEVLALAAGWNVDLLHQQAEQFRPRKLVVFSEAEAES